MRCNDLNHWFTGTQHRRVANFEGKWPVSVLFDKYRQQAMPRRNCPINDHIAFGDEDAIKIATWRLSTLPHLLIAEPHEHRQTRVRWIVNDFDIGRIHGFFARLGATRGGSFGCFGYTGGHGASIMPLAMSRS